MSELEQPVQYVTHADSRVNPGAWWVVGVLLYRLLQVEVGFIYSRGC
jgi:hypothetical protein